MRSTQRVRRLETKAADLIPCPECGGGGRRDRGQAEKMSIRLAFPGDPVPRDERERCPRCGRRLVIHIKVSLGQGR